MQSNQNSKTSQVSSKITNFCNPNTEGANFLQSVQSKHSVHSQMVQPSEQNLDAKGITTKCSHHTVIGQIVPSDIATKHISSQHQSKSIFNVYTMPQQQGSQSKSIFNVNTMPQQQGSKISAQVINQAATISKNSNAITANQVLLQDSNQNQFEAMMSKQSGSKQLPGF